MSKNRVVQSETHTLFDNLYHIEDVARVTGLSKKTIYNLCSLGEIPHLKQRKRLVFIPQEIHKWNLPKGVK